MHVLVTGLPGSGKSTLAGPLADELGLPLLSKDAIKEALWDSLGPGDLEWSTHLGAVASVALLQVCTSIPGAVIDHVLHPAFVPQWRVLEHVVEVRCTCPPAVARTRYRERRRHPSHLDVQRVDAFDGWIAGDKAREALGPRLDVDTTQQPDLALIVKWIQTNG